MGCNQVEGTSHGDGRGNKLLITFFHPALSVFPTGALSYKPEGNGALLMQSLWAFRHREREEMGREDAKRGKQQIPSTPTEKNKDKSFPSQCLITWHPAFKKC